MISLKLFFRFIAFILICLIISLTEVATTINITESTLQIEFYSPLGYFTMVGILSIVILILWNFDYLYDKLN